MKTEIQDFPAAHSMDTSWFGIDENGEIAIFETGENGCLPSAATYSMEQPTWNDFFQLFPKDEDGFYLIPLDGAELAELCTPNNLTKTIEAAEQRKVYSEFFILLMASEKSIKLFSPNSEDVKDEWDYEKPLRFRGRQPLLFVPYTDVTIKKIKEGIKSNEILGIAPLKRNPSRIEKAADAQGLSIENYLKSFSKYSLSYIKKDLKKENEEWFREFLGLHFFGPDDETGFYEAEMRPKVPLKISDLSEKQKRILNPVKFENLKFSETAAIQPAALTDVDQWGMGKTWIDIKGKFHKTQKFKKGVLLKEDKTPYTQEEINKLAIRPLGETPIDPDTIEWPSDKEEITNPPFSNEGVLKKLFKRFF
jgi:hypothetical protein